MESALQRVLAVSFVVDIANRTDLSEISSFTNNLTPFVIYFRAS